MTVHLESCDEVVILEGRVVRVPIDARIADLYEAKYAYRPELGGTWYLVAPARALAWLEADYPRTATRFDFPG